MKKNHTRTIAIVVAILAVLVYLQFRSWRNFDWAEFLRQTRGVNLWHITAAVALIYLSYVLRAVRWTVFLQPTKRTSVRRLLPPQFIGFAALGLFGRAGEFVRPYLIARKEELTLESQLAVWTVERAFDLGAVLVLMVSFLFLSGGRVSHILYAAMSNGLHGLVHKVHDKGWLAVVAAVIAAGVLFLLWHSSNKAAQALKHRIEAFTRGLNTIKDFRAFAIVAVVSLAMWLGIAGAYIEVLHSYPPSQVTLMEADGSTVTRTTHVNDMKLEDVLLLMGGSMLGSVVQLPGGVGGSQLAVIGVLSSSVFSVEPYNVTRELAVSCGIMLWLVTFMSVVPAGLLMARFERISLRAVEGESESAEEEIEEKA
ncbi:MAG TPA: lysylphosphatidylglycerol synthase transmembrane domain-containing protein [Terriglobales bacterium]